MALVYNRKKAEDTLLKTYEASPPSLTVDLYGEFWRLNSGPNCLYSTPIAGILDHITARRVPVDYLEIFHTLNIPFYEGSLIVDIHDHRELAPNEAPTTERVVLWPNDEAAYAEILLSAAKDLGKWSDLDALTFEANQLIQKEPELLLDPDPLISKVVNSTLAVTTPLPYSFKRKREAVDTEQEEAAKRQRAKTMNIMNPRANGSSFVPQ
ncbi:hypothetical protein DL93DRAFT_2057310 [Clavulina sp. PMI_390]|nr:hypothetical protein DL93DRAFT_2057310 [Clavulina sp. PMI_390]